MTVRKSILCVLVLWLFQMGSVHAATFDAAAHFNATTNPNSPWSYGTYTTLDDPNTFALMPAASSILGQAGFNGYNSNVVPLVAMNETASPIVVNGTAVFNPGSLILHPGEAGQQAVVRWEALAAGTYDINGNFFAADSGGSTTTVHGSVFRNATREFTGTVNGPTTDAPFSLTLALNAGDTIDFVVGFGPDNNYFFDSTELQAVITDNLTPVPLPAALPLLAGGLGLMGFMGWRRRRIAAAA